MGAEEVCKVVGSVSFLLGSGSFPVGFDFFPVGAFGGRGNELARGILPAQPGCIQVFEPPLPQAETQPGVGQNVISARAVRARGRALKGLHSFLLHQPQRVEDDVQGDAEVGVSLIFGGPISPPLPIGTGSRTTVK